MNKSQLPPLPYLGEILEFSIRAFSVVDDKNEASLKKELQRLKSGTVISLEDASTLLKTHLKSLSESPKFGLEIVEVIDQLLVNYGHSVLQLNCHNLPTSEVRAFLATEVVPNVCFAFPGSALLVLSIDPCDWMSAPEKTVSSVWEQYLVKRDIAIPALAKELAPQFATKGLGTDDKSIEDNLYRWQKGGRMNVRSVLQFLTIGYDDLAIALLLANAFQRFWASQPKETRTEALPYWKKAYDNGPRFQSDDELQCRLTELAQSNHPERHTINEETLEALSRLRDLTNPEVGKKPGDAFLAETILENVEDALKTSAGIDGLQIYRGRYHILKDEIELALKSFDHACERQSFRNGQAMLATLKPLLVSAAFVRDKHMLNKWSSWAEAFGLEPDLRNPDVLFYKMFPPENYYVETDISKHVANKRTSISANAILEDDWTNRAPDLRHPNRKVKGHGSSPKPQLAIFAHMKQPVKVQQLLTAGADPNALCDNNGSALLNAVQAGCNESFALLLPVTDLKVIDQRTEKTGRTCLSEAVCRGDVNMVRALLGYRTTVDIRGELDTTSLYQAVGAIMENAPDDLLAQIGANQATLNAAPPWTQPSSSPFLTDKLLATEQQHQRSISENPEFWMEMNEWLRHGSGTSLGDRLAIVSELVAAGADPNAKCGNGFTPFLHACELGNQRVIEILTSNGANPRDKDDSGQTCLFLLMSRRHMKVAEWLLKMLTPEDAEYLRMQPGPKPRPKG